MKQIFNVLKWTFFCSIVVFYYSCEENNSTSDEKIILPGSGKVLILNEGSNDKNNAGLSFFNLENGESTFDVLSGSLGDTGQDIIAYGSKLYLAVYGSSNIAVLDLYSHKLLKRIELKDGGQARYPRYLTSHNGKVYASTHDGNVVRVDTVLLQVEAMLKIGTNLEGIAAVNEKLYVANSNGLNAIANANYDSTLYVVDIPTFTKEAREITIGVNPNIVKADPYGNIYLTYLGNYMDNPGGIQRIDTQNYTVTDLNIDACQNFTINDDRLYFYSVTYNEDYSTNCSFGIYDLRTKTRLSDPVVSDETQINTAYGIGVNPKTKDVYISDTDYSNPGIVHIFGPNGKKKATLHVGVNANTFLFY